MIWIFSRNTFAHEILLPKGSNSIFDQSAARKAFRHKGAFARGFVIFSRTICAVIARNCDSVNLCIVKVLCGVNPRVRGTYKRIAVVKAQTVDSVEQIDSSDGFSAPSITNK